MEEKLCKGGCGNPARFGNWCEPYPTQCPKKREGFRNNAYAQHQTLHPKHPCKRCGALISSYKTFCCRDCFTKYREEHHVLHVSCAACGKPLRRPVADSDNERFFCDRKCAAHFFAYAPRTCPTCNKSFVPNRAKQRYCSRTCVSKIRSTRARKHYVTITCEHCGKSLNVSPSIAHRRKFCSKRCFILGSKKIRRSGTAPEMFVYGLLSGLNVPFCYQHPIAQYVVDFYIPKLCLVIDVDGSHWHGPQSTDSDRDLAVAVGLACSVVHVLESDIPNGGSRLKGLLASLSR